jgi:hypothetical protein
MVNTMMKEHNMSLHQIKILQKFTKYINCEHPLQMFFENEPLAQDLKICIK